MLKEQSRKPREVLEFDRPLVTATYFGFRPIRAPKVTDKDLELVACCGSHPHYDAAEKLALLRTYLEENMATLPHPLAISYRKPLSRRKFGTHALHFIGSPSGIAEAALIRATLSILKEEGYKNLRVDLNCVGDKDSMTAYERELGNALKKLNLNLSDEIKQSIKEDIFNLFRMEQPEVRAFVDSLPSSITALTAQARSHFKEVLEFVEALGIEFRLDPHLVGERNHTSHTIFAIKNDNESHDILALGYRYPRLSRFLGLRREIPVTGVSIFSQPLGEVREVKLYKELPRPKFYLVQLGREAKIKTLHLIELLRAERIAVHHFLGKDKLQAQLSSAETLRVSYLIIIGQKEALDNTATVRNMATRAQETVSLVDLPAFLKHISL